MGAKQLNDKTKMLMLFILVVLILGFSWQGSVDDIVRTYLNQSIKDAAVIYGTTRLINAVVSVLQSIDISIVFASVQLGDFLTPIHDTLERFAEVMTYAIVSLTLQRVLIEIVEHSFFNILLTLSGVGLCLAVFFKMYVPQAVRLFITLFFVRFSLALVLMLNMTVDHAFLVQKVQQEHGKMSLMKQELDSTYKVVTGESEQPAEVQTEQEEKPQVNNLPEPIEETEVNVPKNKALVDEQYAEKSTKESSVWGTVSGFVSSKVDAATDMVESVTDTIVDNKNLLLGTSPSMIVDAAAEIVDNTIESGKSLINTKTVVLDELKKLKENAMHWVENFLTLMALFLLKTIFLPLLFWYALLKGMKLIWIKEWSLLSIEKPV